MELSEQRRPGNPGGPRPPRPGRYELHPQVIRGREVAGVWAVVWVPEDGHPHQEMVIVTDRIPMLAEALATFLVEHQLPFGARAQGELRRAGIPFPAEPADDSDPYGGEAG